MENNGKANTMETLKAKVLELKEKWNPPIWKLVAVALVIAIPVAGGWLSLMSFLIGAPLGAVLCVLLGVVGYTSIIYGFIHNFLLRLERTFVVKPEHEDEY